MLDELKKNLNIHYPSVLVDALVGSYVEIKENYYLSKHEPSELNGGKFAESAVRILQFESQRGMFTPIGQQIKDMIGTLRTFEQLPASQCSESYRIHIPRALICIYNIRNKRGVGHLGGDVNPNIADSTLIVAVADWILAEMIRLNYTCSIQDAQKLVDGLVQRRSPLVYNFATVKRVLNPKLSLKQQTLVLLAEEYPASVPVATLVEWIEPSNKSNYKRDVITPLHKDRLINYAENDKSCTISPIGLRLVESNLESWIMK